MKHITFVGYFINFKICFTYLHVASKYFYLERLVQTYINGRMFEIEQYRLKLKKTGSFEC